MSAVQLHITYHMCVKPCGVEARGMASKPGNGVEASAVSKRTWGSGVEARGWRRSQCRVETDLGNGVEASAVSKRAWGSGVEASAVSKRTLGWIGTDERTRVG
jgi:hypothetical protein